MRQSELALEYVKLGISVFPCNGQKRPLTKNGLHDATTSISQVKSWWRKNPRALIGSPNVNFTVVDIDDHSLCSSAKFVTNSIVSRFVSSIDMSNVLIVKTLSGGTHLYFLPHKDMKRKIKILPNIDLLGEGGYVILPDQKNYIADRDPLDAFKMLPEFPVGAWKSLCESYTPEATRFIESVYGSDNRGVKVDVLKKRPDMESVPAMTEEVVIDAVRRDSINYDEKHFSFEQPSSRIMYKENKTVAPRSNILDRMVDGVIEVENGSLTSADLNTLFFSPRIQSRLAYWMGVSVPEFDGKPTSMNSILPGHADMRPSMGVRWNRYNTHIIVRDFANHFSDAHQNLDYNLVRLYATIRYKTLVPRMKPPEFVVWFMRMLVESGIVVPVGEVKSYGNGDFPSGKHKIAQVAEGILLLDAVKSLYVAYDNKTTCSDRFCCAWCGVDPATANRSKRVLHETGYLKLEGVWDCSGGTRDDGFYNTKVFSIITGNSSPSTSINKEAVVKDITESEEVSIMNDKNTNIVSFTGVSVSDKDYQTIKNFCSDYKIGAVPKQKNMSIGLATFEGDHDVVVPANSFLVEDLYLASTDRMYENGSVLMLCGVSDEIDEVADAIIRSDKSLVNISDEPLIGVVISSDFDPEGYDLDMLESKIRTYLNGALNMEGVFVRKTTEDSLSRYILDGLEPEGE